MSDYKKHYIQFSQNADFAARTWHHYIHLGKREAEDPAILNALNKAPRYWRDQRYIAVQTTIIFLGKLFDESSNAYNVDKTLAAAHKNLDYFNKIELRKRKIASGGEFEGIDEYIEKATELDKEDIRLIKSQIKEAKSIWKRLKPLRDKVYAHNQMLSDDEKQTLFDAVTILDMAKVIQILLNISNALLQAESNGHKPNFSSDFTQPIEWAKKDIEQLISSLLNAA